MSAVVDLAILGSRSLAFTAPAHSGAGMSVSGAGDVNGDGFADMLVGAPYSLFSSGAAYLIYGSANPVPLNLSQLQPPAGFQINGRAHLYDYAGAAVSSAGDLNGDGFDDLAVGFGTSYYYARPGSAYVVFGKASGLTSLTIASPDSGPGHVTITGRIAKYGSGLQHINLSSAGDINGDGFDDLIVGDSTDLNGVAYIVFGKASGFAAIDLGTLAPPAGFAIVGDASSQSLGRSVSAAGDVNGDGFADLIVGAYLGNSGGMSSGQAYVIFGKASGYNSIFALSTLTPSAGFMIQGDAAGDWAGLSVSGAGDVNGDGISDIVVGAPLADRTGKDAGDVYVIFGKRTPFANIDLTSLSPNDGFVIHGAAPGDNLGHSVSLAGDINGDHHADLIIGAPNNDAGGQNAGAAYVIFGHDGGFSAIDLANLSPADGVMIRGTGPDSDTGRSVSIAGDVNHDGFDDLLIGAPFSSSGGTASGAAYLVLGRASFAPDAAIDVNGDGRSDILWRSDSGAIATWLASAAGGFTGSWGTNVAVDWLVAGVGDFNGDGRDDILWQKGDSIADWLGATNGGFSVGWGTSGLLSSRIVGIADFNGDGRDDILWRTDAGNVSTWLGRTTADFSVGSTTSVATSWAVAGTGDVNGDGRDDIIWRNDSGAIATWLGTAGGGFNAGWGTAVSLAWHMLATGDFNGDGRTDLLWRSDAGQLSDWLGGTNGGFSPNWGTGAPTGWTLASVGDVNGDGYDDLLWRQDATGQSTAWLGAGNGGFSLNGASYAAAVATNWHVQDPFL